MEAFERNMVATAKMSAHELAGVTDVDKTGIIWRSRLPGLGQFWCFPDAVVRWHRVMVRRST